MITLDGLNDVPAETFAAQLDGVFEHAPWVAARAAASRPFATLAALNEALMQAVRAAPGSELTAFLAAHPELAARNLPAGLTDASQAEQSGLAMHHAAGADVLPGLNRAYGERFGIPFIICVARHTAEDVLRCLETRLAHEPDQERHAALAEIEHITRLRLLTRVTGPGAPPTAGHFSTHVLDLAAGRPAAGLAVTLLQEGRVAAERVTDADGRVPNLLPPGPLRQGRYELQFAAGRYFATGAQPTFYDVIPVRFEIAAAEGRYHVPLLLSPHGYSTYRGS